MYYDVVRGDGGQAVELPISEIPPGECDWKPYAISYSISSTAKNSNGYAALISIDKPDGKPITNMTSSCKPASFQSRSEPFLVCLGNPAPLLKSISKGQVSLEANVLTAPAGH
jgi:hypothetical protein